MNSFTEKLLKQYRKLPYFDGKYRLGHFLFRKALNKPDPVEVVVGQKIRYKLPNSCEQIGKEILVKGGYEEETVKGIVAELRNVSNPVFFDIGANIGAISIPVHKQLPDVEIHAFEASPINFQYLKTNFEQNNIFLAKLLERAVYSSDNLDLKFFDAVRYGESSLVEKAGNKASVVRSLSIDSYCRQNAIAGINVMKIDVQGFEIEVLKGMAGMLRRKKVNAILFEVEDWAEKEAGFEPGTSQRFLLENGYSLFYEDKKRVESILTRGSFMLWAKPNEIV